MSFVSFKRNWKWWRGSTDFSFVDEDACLLRSKDIYYKFRVRGERNPHQVIEHERGSLDVNAFCATSHHKIYVHFFLQEYF